MSNPFEHRRPTELEDKAHAEAVRHFAEHLKQFPASREAVDRLERDLAKIGLAANVAASKPTTAHNGTRTLILWKTSISATGQSLAGRNTPWWSISRPVAPTKSGTGAGMRSGCCGCSPRNSGRPRCRYGRSQRGSTWAAPKAPMLSFTAGCEHRPRPQPTREGVNP